MRSYTRTRPHKNGTENEGRNRGGTGSVRFLVRGMAPACAIKRFNLLGAMMAKPNYSYEKRQKEIAKKKKQEAKRKKKQGTTDDAPTEQK
ncbi:hypothetical protein [Pontiella sp.]|uniref:hypothetical protein n=1 Tax=Pontiella sp. TaxID=2837462 RepID=UPI0035671685